MDLRKDNPLQDLLSSLNAAISTNESTESITGHVIYNPAYTYKFQLKTTQENNSDHSITREMLQWPFIESGLYDFYDIDTAENSVLSQPPSYDEVIKKDSKVIIITESDIEPPSYFEALWGQNMSSHL